MRQPVIRIPRPQGLTLLAQQLHKTKQVDEDTIGNIIKYIIAHNLTIDNKKLSLETLAQYTNKPISYILQIYIRYQDKLSRIVLGNKDKVQGALLFQAFEKILIDKAQIEKQVSVLERAQAGVYKPYISSTLNEALNINMSATKAFMELVRLLKPTGPQVAIQNNFPGNDQHTAMKTIGMDDALRMLEEEGVTKLVYDANRYAPLKDKYLIDVPQVVATKQGGIAKEIPLLGATPLKDKPKKDNKQHHISRRVIELDIDEEEDDQIG